MPPRINQAAIINRQARNNVKNQAEQNDGLEDDAESDRLVEESGKDFDDMNNDEKATRAVEVVRELYKRYQKQTERWDNYVQLFSFLIFVSIFLTVLFLQRNAQVAYAVHSTIKDTLVPGSTTISSSNEVLSWLQSTLAEVWKDPVCGDGVCESPFEFPSYGRFGCRADCGRLVEVQNLTSVLIDLKYNFKHPVGSVPSTELMQQASWNLCPRFGAPHGTDCYYPEDQTFDRIEGEVSIEIPDVPDGQWILVVKRDIFNKVSGAVRNREALEEESLIWKVRMAALAAAEGRNFEINKLVEAEAIANMGYDAVIADYLNSTYIAYLSNVTTQNSTGLFNFEGKYNVSLFNRWNSTFYPFKDPESNRPVSLMQLMPGVYTSASVNHMDWYRATLECSNIPQIYKAGSAVSQPRSPNCERYANVTKLAIERRLSLFLTAIFNRAFLADQHLKAVLADGKRKLSQTHKEVVTAIDALTGRDPQRNPALSTLEDLALFYLEPLGAGVSPPAAKAPLSKTRVLELPWESYQNQTASFVVVLERITARINEIGDMDDIMETELPEVKAMRAFERAVMGKACPDGRAPPCYNYVSWSGGPEAYMTMNLTLRAPEYVGVCRKDVVVTQTTERQSASLTYVTTQVPDIKDPSVRTFIDLDGCKALCFCPDETCEDTAQTSAQNAASYSATYCECDICRTELQDPTQDDAFKTIEASFTAAGSAAGNLGKRHRRHQRRLLAEEPDAVAAHRELLHLKHAALRRLRQAGEGTEIELLNRLISDVGDLGGKQTGLSDQVSKLEQEVIRASQAAEQRAADKTLEDLINAGRQDIKAGQERVEALLGEIIEKQNQAAAAAEQAAAALAQIQELQTQMVKSQQLVELGVQKQLQAIMVAGQQQMISLADALVLWRKARVDRLKFIKQVALSNLQTGDFSTVAYGFDIARYSSTDPATARERHIGLTNRVIAGMLVHTTRTLEANCSSSRFKDIDNICTGDLDRFSYGVDPVFKRGAEMYNPDLDNELAVTSFYNCTSLNLEGGATYNRPDPVNPGAVTNKEPYCFELFNERDIPWGFHHFGLDQYDPGFPVWFDINLSEDTAQRLYKYVEEGLFLDANTQKVQAQVVTYNSELRVFSSTMVTFKYSDGGSIDVSHKLHTVRVELYADKSDIIRLCLEIFLTVATCVSLFSELKELFVIWRRTGSASGYFASAWNWIDLTSIGLMWCTMCMWWIFVLRQASAFDIELRYEVYEDLGTPAAMLRLAGSGAGQGQGLTQVQEAFGELQDIVDSLAWYYAINGINILLLISRVLKLMDFQPRLGVVTRSLALAGPDLAHFVLVCGMVFVGYAMMAHLIFGNNIQAFSSFGTSIDTCFEILLGEISVNAELRALTGLQGLAGTLFFWSFELLVFMVLLNFLLAIIVDAFSEVKENTTEQTGLHTEVGQMIAEKWRSVTACFGRSQHIPDRRLGQLLKQWGGDDDDGDDDSDDNEKRLHLLDAKLDADELAAILKECLASSEGDFESSDSGSKGLFGMKKKAGGPPTEEEIAMAAEYVVARFGQIGGDDEEDKEEENEGAGVESLPINSSTGERLYTEKALEKERDALAQALDRLSDVQRQLAEGQQKLMTGQSQLKSQHERLLDLMSSNNK